MANTEREASERAAFDSDLLDVWRDSANRPSQELARCVGRSPAKTKGVEEKGQRAQCSLCGCSSLSHLLLFRCIHSSIAHPPPSPPRAASQRVHFPRAEAAPLWVPRVPRQAGRSRVRDSDSHCGIYPGNHVYVRQQVFMPPPCLFPGSGAAAAAAAVASVMCVWQSMRMCFAFSTQTRLRCRRGSPSGS